MDYGHQYACNSARTELNAATAGRASHQLK